MNNYVKKEILELVALGVYVALTLGTFSLFAGLGLGGFERTEILEKNNFYIPYGVLFFLVGIVGLKAAGILIFSEKNKNIEGVVSHDPEQGVFRGVKIFTNPFLLLFFCIIFFSLLGWMASVNQEFVGKFYGLGIVPDYQQQFTPAANLYFSVYPASPSETLGALFLINIIGFILGYMAFKGKLKWQWFIIMFVIGATIVSLIFGVVNHLARYGSSDIAMSSVGVFWSIGGLITALTGSAIPFLVMHDANNFYYKFSTLFSSQVVTFTTITVLSLLFIIFLLILFKSRAKKNEKY